MIKIINKIIFTSFLFIYSFSLSAQDKKIEITGNDFVDEEVIYSIISNYLTDINDNNINNIINDLKKTGAIKDVKILNSDDLLKISIKENPKILNINFIGNERFKKNEILEIIDKENNLNFYTNSNINNFIEDIKNLYMSFGYNKIAIDYSLDEIDNSNFVDITFNIIENKISKVNKIYFIGNTNININSLKDIIKTKERNFLQFYKNNNFKKFEANNDIFRLKDLYYSKGFKNVNVEIKTEFINDKNKFNIYFYIEENLQFFINNLNLQINHPNIDLKLEDELNSILSDEFIDAKNPKKNIIYNNQLISNIKEKLTNHLFDKGLMFFQIKILEKEVGNKVDIILQIQSINNNFVKEINIYGNSRTLDEVIRREVVFSEGDPVNSYLIERTNRNLNNLTFFESTDIKLNKISTEESVVDIYLKEKPTGDFKIGASFGSLNGASFLAGLSEKNVGGTGRNLNFTIDTSSTNTTYEFNVVEPYIFNKKLSFIYGINYSEKNYKKTASYNLNILEFKTGIRYDLINDLTHSIMLQYNLKDYLITDETKVAKSILNSQGGNADFSIVNKFTLNKLDSFIRPTTGNYLSFFSKVSQKLNSSDGYLNNTLIYKKYNLVNKNIISFQSKIGNIYSFGSRELLSDNKYSLGGRWLRGFDSFGVGPRESSSSYIGGKNLITAKIDISRPISNTSDNPIDLNLFTDIGKIWGNKNSPSFNEETIRSSYGAGIKFYTPIGPVGFSWAFPISDETYDNKRMFLFSIGDLN